MKKDLHTNLSASDRHATAGPFASFVWAWVLPQTDAYGRYSRVPAFVRSQALPMFALRLKQVEEALNRLAQVGLLHFYDVDGLACLVFHKHERWNSLKGLKWRSRRWPTPPTTLCPCVTYAPGEKKPGTGNDVATSINAPPSLASVGGGGGGEGLGEQQEAQLMHLAMLRGIPNEEKTILRYVRAWALRAGFDPVKSVLSDKAVNGWDVLQINDKRISLLPPPFQVVQAPPRPRCTTCHGERRVVDHANTPPGGITAWKGCPDCMQPKAGAQ